MLRHDEQEHPGDHQVGVFDLDQVGYESAAVPWDVDVFGDLFG